MSIYDTSIQTVVGRPIRVGLVLVVVIGLLLGVSAQHRGEPIDLRPGLPLAVRSSERLEGPTLAQWNNIRDAIRHVEYDLTWDEASAAYFAPNRANDWQIRFERGGVEVTPWGAGPDWSLNFKTVAYGHGAQRRAIAGELTQSVADNRLTYAWGDGLGEWFVNDENGLEHGFTIQRRATSAADRSPLVLDIQYLGSLRPSLEAGRQAIRFENKKGVVVLRYHKLHVTDKLGQVVPAHLSLAPVIQKGRDGFTSTISITVDDARAIYPLTVDPILVSQATRLKPTGSAFDEFGRSIAIDGQTMVVGAPYADLAGNLDQGAAYIFRQDQSGTGLWRQVKKLVASDGAAGDGFGASVAISGQTVVAGARWADEGGSVDQGAVYVFSQDEGGTDNWGQVAKLTTDAGAAEDQFGASVEVLGEVAFVGVPFADVATDMGISHDQGMVYIFGMNNGGANAWGMLKELTGDDSLTADRFGGSVAATDGSLVVGARFADVGGNQAQGAAYVFGQNQGGANAWGQVAKLTANDGASTDEFGGSVAIAEQTVVVSAANADINGNLGQGAAYIFEQDQGGINAWGQVTKLIAEDGDNSDLFGTSVAVSGQTVFVGARWADVGGSIKQGAAYVYGQNQGGAGAWGQVTKVVAEDGSANDNFGWSMAASGATLVVGVGQADNEGRVDQGAAYVFNQDQGGIDAWGQFQKLAGAEGAADDEIGFAVAISGQTAVVGAPFADVGAQVDRGVVYVFDRDQGGLGVWGQVKKLTAADGVAGDLFGHAVTIEGETIIVGAPGADVSGNIDQGAAYVFSLNEGGLGAWGQLRKLTGDDGAANDSFGWSMAVDGANVVVGAPDASVDGIVEQGAAYIFGQNEGGANAWGQVRKLTADDGAAGDHFGNAVSIAEQTAVVGAYLADVGDSIDQGASYIFGQNQGGANMWGQSKKLLAGDGLAGDQFGTSLATDAQTILVGSAEAAIGGQVDQGAAYVFDRDQGGSGNWGQVKKLTASDGATGDLFGASVGIYGPTAVVGAPDTQIGANPGQGAAYVYGQNQDGINAWGGGTKLTAADGNGDDAFGSALAIFEGTVVTGSPRADSDGIPSVGAAYIFAVTQQFDVTVQKAGNGTGNITSVPPGVNCGSTCSVTLDAGTSTTLTASAGGFSLFTGWSGACTGTGLCSLTMDASKQVTATFTLKQFDLTVLKAGNGAGTVTSVPAAIACGASCSAELDAGSAVTLTAAPAQHSSFVGWSGACSGTSTCTVNMTSAKQVTATFKLKEYVLSVQKAGSGVGIVTSTPSVINCGSTCSASLDAGTTITLKAIPDPLSTFAGWTGACGGTGSCKVDMLAAKSVTATFNSYRLYLPNLNS